MRCKLLGFAAASFALAVFLSAAVPARAEDVDQKIKALEDQLTQLKSEQAQVKSEQIEMRKEATAAAAALPTFSYRPGSGMMIEAADKSWSFRASMEAQFRLLFEAGLTNAGRETGGIMGRRFRPTFFYCVNDCLYEIETSIDLDGFGTGNAKNATATGLSSILQRGVVWMHLEHINPWLPTFYTGMDGPAAMSTYRKGSSATAAQLEYDLLSRSTGFNTGRWGNGFGLNWQDISLSGIGIPGRIPLLNVVYATIGEGDDGTQSFREQRSVSAYFKIEPFSQVKNKWIRGLGFELGSWFCPNDPTARTVNPQDIACNRLRIRDNGDGGRQTLFDSTVTGSGMTHMLLPGFGWSIGPYQLRAVMTFQHYDGNNSGNTGKDFLIGHDLYIWSPKGFLTGNASTPGSILLGYHFERTEVSCPRNLLEGSGAAARPASCNNGLIPGRPATETQFSQNAITLHEWDIWYVLMNRMSVGAAWDWFGADNVRAAQGSVVNGIVQFPTAAQIASSSNAQRNLGCTNGAGTVGASCHFLNFSVTWRYQF
jgi:hypothetical protein